MVSSIYKISKDTKKYIFVPIIVALIGSGGLLLTTLLSNNKAENRVIESDKGQTKQNNIQIAKDSGKINNYNANRDINIDNSNSNSIQNIKIEQNNSVNPKNIIGNGNK